MQPNGDGTPNFRIDRDVEMLEFSECRDDVSQVSVLQVE